MTQGITNFITKTIISLHVLYYMLIFSLVVLFPIVMIYKGLIK